jgi:hypothetical protein
LGPAPEWCCRRGDRKTLLFLKKKKQKDFNPFVLPLHGDTNRPKCLIFRRFGRLVSRAGLAGGGAQCQDSCRPPSTDPSSGDS